jgi:murein DD-endopeptidase
MKISKPLLARLALLTVALPMVFVARTAAQTEHTPKPVGPPLDVVVREAPHAFRAGGKWNLVYELHVTNFGKYDCLLTRVEIFAEKPDAKPLATYSRGELESIVTRPGLDVLEKVKIGPGQIAVIYLWVSLDGSEKLDALPKSLLHRIEMKIGDYPEAITLDGVPVAVDKNPVTVIAPPLRGEDWLAGNGPSNNSVHRRALIPVLGRAYISQRYAIDWVQLYPDGKTYKGDAKDNRSYRGYGTEIHAVADGVVTQTKDGIQQNVPNEKPAVPITLETIGGNHVIVDIGGGLFAFYAHMQPGSVRVKVGDRIRRGDVLGLVGNSGNSSEPHLHFHLCDANSELACEGIPYAFASFEVQGSGWGWKSSEPHDAPVKRELEMPAENDVVRFLP